MRLGDDDRFDFIDDRYRFKLLLKSIDPVLDFGWNGAQRMFLIVAEDCIQQQGEPDGKTTDQ